MSNQAVHTPASWSSHSLGDLLDISYGKGLPARNRVAGGVPVFSSAGQTGEHNQALTTGPVLVVARKGVGVGDVFYADEPCWVIDTALYAPVPDGCDAQFLLWLLRSVNLSRLDRSSAIPGLSRRDLSDVRVALPDRREQEAIVAALLRHLSDVEQGEGAFLRARSALETFTASVRGAVFGRWQVSDTLQDVAAIQSGIAKGRPSSEASVERPYLRTANVQAGWLDLDLVKTIQVTEDQERKHLLQRGDVLVLEGGDADKVGRGWVWDAEIEPCLHQNHVFAVRVDQQRLAPRFLAHYLNAPQARAYFASCAKQTTNLASINKSQMRSLPVPVPDLGEQEGAVGVLDAQLAAARALETDLSARLRQADRLRAAILHAAFTGRLLGAPEAHNNGAVRSEAYA